MKPHLPIGVSEASFDQAEEEAVLAVLRSGWITQGERVQNLEKAFVDLAGFGHGVAVNSCTSGLHLALAALGIEADSEVLTPGLTFVATANAAIYAGCKPVPVDIEALNIPHISLAAAERALTPRTKAVFVMHHAGYYVDMQKWSAFAAKHNLLLVEDAAHCPGLSDLGRYSHAAVLSFFGNKNMTTAEGGLVFTKDEALAEKMRMLRGHAMSTPTLTRAKGHAFSYDVEALGWNYRMDDLRAAIGLAQFKKLPAFNAKRLELAGQYRTLLTQSLPQVIVPFTPDWPTTCHLQPVLLPENTDRPALMAQMREKSVQTSIHYPMWHKFSWHNKVIGDYSLPVTEGYCARTLTLPLHPGLTAGDVEYVVETLAGALRA